MARALYIRLILLLLFSQGCNQVRVANPESGVYDLVVLYTNDEHGWMEATDDNGGAIGLADLWQSKEHYAENKNFLILSGGDMWTGPALSTWFKGEPMVQVMNALHYDAAAIGNHEFDFKIDVLKANMQRAQFPFLAANMRYKSNGKIPEFIQPYLIKDINGLQVGIVGLSNKYTALNTFPAYVADFDFIDYASALDEVVPLMKKEGAEFIIIVGHICSSEMKALAPKARELGISVITGGHCHEEFIEVDDGLAMIESGSYLKNYVRLEITYDQDKKQITRLLPSLVPVKVTTSQNQVSEIVDKWQAKLGDQLSQVIGFADPGIGENATEMRNMVTDSWLVRFPQAEISITNTGGIRQSIPAGNITLETMVGVLPFENTLYELDMTGQEVMDVLNQSGYENLVFGGMTMTDGFKLQDGSDMYPDSVYQVITTDYLYSRPDYSFEQADPEPYPTSVQYRQPVIDWIRNQNSSAANPLNNYLDPVPRK